MSDWNFGGAFANTTGELQRQDVVRQTLPLELAHMQATTRLNNAQADLYDHKRQAQDRMASIMQGMTLNDPNEPQSASILKMAGAAMQAGDPTTAQELILRSAQTHTQETQQAEIAARTATQQATVKAKMADRYATLMNGVNSQADFDRANLLFASEFGQMPPQMQYDPNTVRLLQQSAIKARDQAYMDHLKVQEGISRATLGSTEAYRQAMVGIRRQEADARIARDQAANKVGGKDVGSPTKSEIDQAKDLLDREGKAQGLDTASARTAAFDLASRARALRRKNPGLDAGEATQRALTEQITEGYYATRQATSLTGRIFGRKEQVYGKPGASADRALAVPADRSQMQPKTYYQTPKGALLYLGDGKWMAPDNAGGK